MSLEQERPCTLGEMMALGLEFQAHKENPQGPWEEGKQISDPLARMAYGL